MTAVYVSNADSGDIRVLRLDAARGVLSPVQPLPVGDQVMPLAVRPDRRFLYAALRSKPYAVVSLRIDPADGRLDEAGRAPLPDSMAYVATDRSGRHLFAASYGGHKVSVSPIGTDGIAGAPSQVIDTGRHAHAVLAAPDNRHVFVTSLGTDQVMQFRFDAASGRLTPNTPPVVAARAGAGPRHFVFHPGGRFVHLLNELDGSVDALAFDAATGTLRAVQTIDALPAGFTGKPWAADLHLTPDGRFLYVCERTSSTLACLRVDAATGRLSRLAHIATEAQPRGFNVDPSGRYLVAAGQLSDAATLYAIDPESGALAALQTLALGRNPNWIEIVAP